MSVKRLYDGPPPALHRASLGDSKCLPLTWAAFGGGPPGETRLAMAQWMIENGSDIHQGDDGPLIRAMADPTFRMAELLVAHGADVNALYGGTYPIIMFPLEEFGPQALKWLLDHGADLHAAAAKYCCPIGMLTCIYMRRPKDKAACLEIVGAAGFPLPDTPMMALHRSRLDLLQEHLDRDPSLLERRFTYGEVFFNHDGTPGDAYPATPVTGCTLLHLALEFDDIDVARWLIERGADVNARATIDAAGFQATRRSFSTPSSTWPRAWAWMTTQSAAPPRLGAPIPTPVRPSRRRTRPTALPPLMQSLTTLRPSAMPADTPTDA